MKKGSVSLDPSDEFEAELIAIVEMHREKSVAYGDGSDSLKNFYNIAEAQGITPLMASEHLAAKHGSVIREYVHRDRGMDIVDSVPHTKYTDDAFLDRAVYGVLSLVLYRRELEE